VVVKVPLNEIDICDISFVFGDSMVMMDKPNRRKPFLKDELLEHLFQNGNDIEKLLDSVNQQIGLRAIEAQIWNDKYFKR